MFKVPNQFRIREGQVGSNDSVGKQGAFQFTSNASSRELFAIASEGKGWEHVSVSMKGKTPNWDEMCQVKALFWDDEDIVVQYNPKNSQYVNQHNHCLHMWSPTRPWERLPIPSMVLVSIKNSQ